MKYYPKSQIKTGLYTKGNEFVDSLSNESYKGFYWGTSAGEFYTGKTPDDISNRLSSVSSIDINTLQINQNTITNNTNSYYIPDQLYNQAKNISNNIQAPNYPKQYNPIPLQEDYTNGYITRYFLKKNNENKFIEISISDYQLYNLKSLTVQSELYDSVLLKWYINGSKPSILNQSSVIQIENSQGWYGFIQYFKGKFDKFIK